MPKLSRILWTQVDSASYYSLLFYCFLVCINTTLYIVYVLAIFGCIHDGALWILYSCYMALLQTCFVVSDTTRSSCRPGSVADDRSLLWLPLLVAHSPRSGQRAKHGQPITGAAAVARNGNGRRSRNANKKGRTTATATAKWIERWWVALLRP